MKIDFNESEILKLSILAYLGNWMRDSYRTDFDSEDDDFRDLEYKIYGKLAETKFKSLVKKFDDQYEETKEFEELVDEYIKNYNEDIFKDEILDLLTRNHMILDLGTDKYNSLTEDEFYEIGLKTENKILKKIAKSGFKTLYI